MGLYNFIRAFHFDYSYSSKYTKVVNQILCKKEGTDRPIQGHTESLGQSKDWSSFCVSLNSDSTLKISFQMRIFSPFTLKHNLKNGVQHSDYGNTQIKMLRNMAILDLKSFYFLLHFYENKTLMITITKKI